MFGFLRLLLIWLTALALPVQGVAAATLAHCGPSHQRMHAHASAHANAHAHAHAHANAHGHGQAQALAYGADPGSQADLASYTCGACASCCTGLALLSPGLHVPEPLPVVPAFAVLVPGIDDVAQSGPDRPPRPNLA